MKRKTKTSTAKGGEGSSSTPNVQKGEQHADTVEDFEVTSSNQKRVRKESGADNETAKNTPDQAPENNGNSKVELENPTESQYEYILTCPLNQDPQEESDEELEWEDLDDDGKDSNDGNDGNDGDPVEVGDTANHKEATSAVPKCGSGDCMCARDRKISDYPDWEWRITRGGWKKFIDISDEANYRNPYNFSIYTFNDHAAYGVQEVVENWFIDFHAAKDVKDKWMHLEGLAYFLNCGASIPWHMIDDADTLWATVRLVGIAFLTTLHELERQDLLEPDTEILNIGLIMGLFLNAYSIFGDGEQQSIKFGGREAIWPEFIVAYARKYSIKIGGSVTENEIAEYDDEDIVLPKRQGKSDPWGFQSKFRNQRKERSYGREYKVDRAGHGIHYDITKWTSKERAKASFDKKDPLPKDVIAALKRGERLAFR
ncbi:hypothetical protein ABW19_dt0206048 [Dactylella cylindrospora]|nr:hypothetical protein ABW19_dt0206048 [Dactylella cylindrospora]